MRAGGGIGDVIEPADGDTKEYYRIVFDITFFFFVIVILLAILQGLIIDAFGELRGQLQSVSDTMEASCFICGIEKETFNKVPHGFETHVKKEHDLANYLFFLMHLINKPDTDYTGQESFVWEQVSFVIIKIYFSKTSNEIFSFFSIENFFRFTQFSRLKSKVPKTMLGLLSGGRVFQATI